MTRETKIGLLVGLAFIIVIGILLSDHLTSSTEPPQATLAVAGSNVRSGVTTPGTNNTTPITPNVTPPTVAPRTTVPTQNDLAPKAQPVQPVQVAVGGPTSAAPPIQAPAPSPEVAVAPPPATPAVSGATTPGPVETPIEISHPEPTVSKPAPIVADPPPAAPVTTTTNNNNNDIAAALREAARQHGEELVAVGSEGNSGGSTLASSRQSPAGTKPYVAVEGDSLSKIAAKFFGSNSKANREAIIAANASLKADPNKLLVGRTYNIPVSAPASSGMSSAPVAQAPPTIIQAPTAPVATNSGNDTWYTVKEGDSLWRIATEQCGTSAAIQAIKDLNKDTLHGDTVVVNTKIRLPNKVASAN